MPTPPEARQSSKTAILRGHEIVHETEYLTDAFAREAVAFIERFADRPFVLYLPFNAPHGPLQATEKYIKRFDRIPDVKRRTFAAMVSAMDDAVGDVLDALQRTGNRDNTLVFFLSDNGGPTPTTTSGNGPFNGGKGTVYEGGTRVPFIARWPATLPAGMVYEQPVLSLDIIATALSAAGIAPTDPNDAAKLDGVNLLPHLTGENPNPPHDVLFWRFGRQRAVRRGGMKLIWLENRRLLQLYDLSSDPQEKQNIAVQHPELVRQFQSDFEKWNRDLVDPLWGFSRFADP